MDINNTLENGLHVDHDPNAQPLNSARESHNGDITPLGNGRYRWENYKGNTLSFELTWRNDLEPFQVIGWYSFPDVLIIFSASSNANGQQGEIGYVTIKNDGTADSYKPLYFNADLAFTIDHPIPHDGIVGRQESASIKRVVWTDNYNSIRSINYADSRYNNVIGTSEIVEGKKYMVLTNATGLYYITYDGNDYGPGTPNGNIFTGTATTTYTSTDITKAWVIDYVAVESLDLNPQFMPGNIELMGYANGDLLTGLYQYFYQLETEDGFATNWSYLSLPVYLTDALWPGGSILDYAKKVALPPLTASGKGIVLKIDHLDNTTYSRIKVGYIRQSAYNNFGPPAEIGNVFYYEPFTTTSVQLTHVGTETIIEKLTLDDLTIPASIVDMAKSICTTKNILFAANLNLQADPKYTVTPDINVIDYLMPTDTLNLDDIAVISTLNSGVFGHERYTANVPTNLIYPYQWYVVSANGSDYANYDGTAYYDGDIFQGVSGINSYTMPTGTVQVQAIIRTRKYSAITSSSYDKAWNIHRINTDFVDHKGLMMTHYMKSRWRGEKYRFGIMCFGKKGQPNFVQWIGDKTMPEQYATTDPDTGNPLSFDPRLAEYSDLICSLRLLGVSFSNIDFNAIAAAYGCSINNLDSFVKGFSIVQVERDAEIVSQGILYPNVINKDNNDYTNIMAAELVSDDYNDTRRPYSYMFYSPEFNTGYEASLQQGDTLKIVSHYEGITNSATFPENFTLISNNFGYVQKYYTESKYVYPYPINNNGYENPIDLTNTVAVGTDEAGVNIAALPDVFDNYGKCGATYHNSIGERETHGIEGIYMSTINDETGNDGMGYAEGARRILVNVVRSKSVLYGGDTESVLANQKYIFIGHYQPLDEDFMTYMTGTNDDDIYLGANTKSAGIVNNVEVFGGDCFVTLFGLSRVARLQNPAQNNFSEGFVIPIESNVNDLWRGREAGVTRTLNRDRFYEIGQPPYNGAYQIGGTQGISNDATGGTNEISTLDNVYSGAKTNYFFPARPLDFVSESYDKAAIIYSNTKIDGELMDNWKIFPIAHKRRVDSGFGGITNIRAKGARLIYWQEKAFGYMPVLERQLASNDGTEMPIQLGVGGILDRFDEIDYWYGNQHQMGLMENENSYVWFDWRRKTMLRLSFMGEKAIVSVVKGMDAFFQNKFTEVENISSPSIFTAENPLIGMGIISYYDQRGRRGFMSFKYSDVNGIPKDFTVVLNEMLDKYVATTDFVPHHIINHNGHLLATFSGRRTIDYDTTYNVGDILVDGWVNYICWLSYTTDPITIDPPSLDPSHWQSFGSINEIYVSWRGDMCKFFGITYPSYLSVILRGEGGDSFAADNCQVVGNDRPFTDIIVSDITETEFTPYVLANSEHVASDLNIRTTDKNYKYVDGGWFFNLPFSRKARLVNNFLQLRMEIKNYITDRTTSLNQVKQIFSIKSSLRKKL